MPISNTGLIQKQDLKVKGSNKAILFVTFVQIAIGPRFPKLTATFEAGYRHIDCARAYADEKEVMILLTSSLLSIYRQSKNQFLWLLKKLFDDGIVKREELFITSKLWRDSLK
ncbi:hypothetical protein K2173_008886 [Erythroxylum novogranatense]|uniref:NADP-dependent oxidoreductase domain-containing protein n=1 Tax=Erythroxylum novogranatense TaxID=1862640 RepID=A0AAV8S4I3_9ROSI|nr:hypothetical protein K2173_008886 [Erythroxylum novogranatense]